MTMKVRAIKIDVEKKSVYSVELNPQSLDDIYTLLGCDCFCIAFKIENGDTVIVDDEGLLRSNPLGAFKFGSYPQPLSGNGLVIGVDSRGETVDIKANTVEIYSQVEFLPVEVLKSINTTPTILTGEDAENYFKKRYGYE
jgi:hypothetical protein